MQITHTNHEQGTTVTKVKQTNRKELQKGTVLGKFPCPACLSRDNLVVYVKHNENGDEYMDAHCHTPSCDNSFMTEKMLKEQGVLDEDFKAPKVPKVVKTAITYEEYLALTERIKHPEYALTSTVQPDGSLYRGITPETAKFYGHLYERNSDGWIIKTYYPETKTGFMNGKLKSLRGYKTRLLPKNFSTGVIGATGRSNDFSGQSMFKTGGKWVLVVGGEEDKLASAQMLRDYQIQRKQDAYDRIAVVSPTTGEGSLAKQCADNYEWLDTFEEIIIAMDNDEAGHNATQEALRVLPEGKVKVMHLSGEDCSEMLQNGRQKQFISNFYDAKPLVPDEVKTSKQADDELEIELARKKIPLPPFMTRLERHMAGGIPLGYMVNLGAITGGGKTTIINEMIYYWVFNSPVKVGILSLELNAGQYQMALLSRHIGYKLALIEDPEEAVKFVQQPHIMEQRKTLRENDYGEERYVLLDERSGDLSSVKRQILKLIKKYGCQLIVIDPVNDLFDGASLDSQQDFIKFMKTVIKEGVSIFNVCHLTKGKTATDREGNRIVRKLTEDDFAGVSNLVKSGGCNITATRDKLSEDPFEQNSTEVEVLKCRWSGNTGYAGTWYYDNQTHTLHDRDEWLEAHCQDGEF